MLDFSSQQNPVLRESSRNAVGVRIHKTHIDDVYQPPRSDQCNVSEIVLFVCPH